MYQTSTNQATHLSVDVEPFVPRLTENETNLMLNGTLNPLPSYVTTCYPFVQDQEALRAANYQWQLSPIMQQAGGIIQQSTFHSNAPGINLQPPILAQPRNAIYSYQPNTDLLQQNRTNLKTSTAPNNHRLSKSKQKGLTTSFGKRCVGVQMENFTEEWNSDDIQTAQDKSRKKVEMSDACLQTDFPLGISSQPLKDKPSPLKKLTKKKIRSRRSAANQVLAESSSDHNGDDADVDSDSGYYSPKHQLHFSRKRNQANSMSSQTEAKHSNATSPRIVPSVYLSPPPQAQIPPYMPIPNQAMYTQPGLGYMMTVNPPLVMTPFGPNAPGIGFNRIPFNNMQPYDFNTANRNFQPGPGSMQGIYPGGGIRQRFPHSKYGSPKHNYNMQEAHPHPQGDHYFAQCYQHPELFHLKDRNNNNKQRKKDIPNSDYVDTVLQNSRGIIKIRPENHNLYQAPPALQSKVDFPGLGDNDGSMSQQSTPFSYSAALQKPKIDANDMMNSPDKNSKKRRKKAERAAKAAEEEYAEIKQEQENIKKAYKSSAKKNRSSSQLDLGEILDKLDRKQSEVGQIVANDADNMSSDEKALINKERSPLPHQPKAKLLDSACNPLDPTAPIKRRGKEREIPKTKKPSALKKVILKEREEKKSGRLTVLESAALVPDFDIPGLPSDFINSDISQPDNSQSSVSSATTQSDPQTLSQADNSLPKIHSRRFREYCCQMLDKQIDDTCTVILQRLVQFQDRMYQKDPVKAKMRRRFVLGLREVTKHLKLKHLKCILISPNLEKIQSKGGLDDAMQQILNLCNEQNVPYVFALGRCAMGRAVSKLVPVSIIGIFDYGGVEEQYKKLMVLVQDAQSKYQEMMSNIQQDIIEANSQPLAPTGQAKRFVQKGHSRNPSAASCMSFSSMISEPISEMNPDAEVSNWRTIMEVNDLSPPPENGVLPTTSHATTSAVHEDIQKANESPETADESVVDQPGTSGQSSVKEMEGSFTVESSTIKRSDSYISEGKLSEIQNEKSFSTCSTLQANKSSIDQNEGSKHKSISSASEAKLEKVNENIPAIESIIPGFEEDTKARITSWLEAATHSVSKIDLADKESGEETPDKLESD